MQDPDFPLVDTTLDGPRTHLWRLQANIFGELPAFRLARLGIDETCHPYRRVRVRPEGSFVLGCLAGEGNILLEGRWQKVKRGDVVMAPPRVLNAFYTSEGKSWSFAWMRYDEPPGVRPIIGANAPLRTPSCSEEIGRVLMGLRAECTGLGDLSAMHHWLHLADMYARRLASAWRGNERLWQLWKEVEGRLAQPWKLSSLAAHCHISPEHLRRICQQELGRSPMEHLTFIRMQHAQAILETTQEKIEAVAASVGYRSAVVFSRAFTRCIGSKPSAFRSRAYRSMWKLVR